MPLYDDPFSGHQVTDDPRNLLFNAGGCTWPTRPPWRWIICGRNPWGILAPIAGLPIVLQWNKPNQDHDDGEWIMISAPFPVVAAAVSNEWNPDVLTKDWYVGVSVTSPCGIIEWNFDRPLEAGNRDYLLGAKDCPGVPSVGGFGSDTWLLQCFYNATTRGDENCPPPAPP